MRAAVLRVHGASSEQTLDALLPVAPMGVHERARGEEVEFVCCEPPPRDALLAAAGGALRGLRYVDLPDDHVARRAALYEPRIVAGSIHLRPDWAPPVLEEGLLDIVLDERAAFGTGAHPTTRMCLAVIAEQERGSLADLGCGTGVLGVVAARLGFGPVVACDYDEESVAATRAAAAANGADVAADVVDLLAADPPSGDVVVANVPPVVHAAISARLEPLPRVLVVSGVRIGEDEEWLPGYRARGLRERGRRTEGGWHCVLLEPGA